MTTGVTCTARPGCEGIAPADTECCADCAKKQRAAGRRVRRLPLLIATRRAQNRQPDREAGA